MKKIFILLIVFLLIFKTNVLSQSSSSSAQSKEEKINQQEIETFKEKIASKVAEIKEKDQQAVSGYAKEISKKRITLLVDQETSYQVELDDVLTKYYQIQGNNKKEINFDDLKKDDYLIVNGLINNNTITANEIYIDQRYISRVAQISEINPEKYQLIVFTQEKEQFTLDIETTTKQLILNIKNLTLEKTGFSKIKQGDTIQFIIKDDQSIKNKQYSAVKIIVIPQEFFTK